MLVATTNAGKLREIRPLLAELAIDLVTLDGWPAVEVQIGRAHV